MKDAEIAKLRAEVEELREESAARLQRFCVPHWGDKNEGRCPICERDHITSEWSRDRNAFIAEKDDLHSHLATAQKERDAAIRYRDEEFTLRDTLAVQLAATRAALKVEREACDRAYPFVRAYDLFDGSSGSASWLRDYAARRAAEAKCDGCDLTRGNCDEGKARGAIKCCPDCDHGAAEAKAIRGGESAAQEPKP